MASSRNLTLKRTNEQMVRVRHLVAIQLIGMSCFVTLKLVRGV